MVEWMRVARGHEIKIFTKDGSVTKFAGFKESVSQYHLLNMCIICLVCFSYVGDQNEYIHIINLNHRK